MDWNETPGMLETIAIFLIVLCVALVSGAANWVLRNFRIICWIVMLLFLLFVGLQAKRMIQHGGHPALVIICLLISQVSFGFFVLLTLRDLALVAKQGFAGLIGFLVLIPFYWLGLVICRFPNLLSRGAGDDPWLMVLDAIGTPGLIALACWIFRFFDSVPSVLHALFGG